MNGDVRDPRAVRDGVLAIPDAGSASAGSVSAGSAANGPRAADQGLHVVDLGEPSLPPVPELGDAPTAGEVVGAALIGSARRLLANDAGVRSGEDPEAVHQARVATRRLRSDLRTWRTVLDPVWAEELRDELGWLAASLGAVRDADVLLGRVRAAAGGVTPEDLPALEAILERLEDRRADARATLLERMRSDRYTRLLALLVDHVRAPRTTEDAHRPASAIAPLVMSVPFRRARTAFAGLGPDASDGALHAARIRVKRVRYAAESLVPVYGKRARRFAARAERLQSILGAHQDAVVAIAWLREVAAGIGQARPAFVAGELALLERGEARAARSAWPAAWEELSRKRGRFWT